MPDLKNGPLSHEQNQRLGRAAAIVEACGDVMDTVSISSAAQNLPGLLFEPNLQKISAILHKTLAKLEMQVSISVQGAFIVAGNAFDAFAALSKVFSTAQSDVLIVDPYMDHKTPTDFAASVPEGVLIRLLADESDHKSSLRPAVTKWLDQFGSKRPLEARLAPAGSLHDRLIVVDGKTAYTLTQSLNAFATRAPASVVRVDAETGALKIAAYVELWKLATPL